MAEMSVGREGLLSLGSFITPKLGQSVKESSLRQPTPDIHAFSEDDGA